MTASLINIRFQSKELEMFRLQLKRKSDKIKGEILNKQEVNK